MSIMNRAPWLSYAWAIFTVYGVVADRRWLLAAAVVALAGIARSRIGTATAGRDAG
jgi:hypothetical protein